MDMHLFVNVFLRLFEVHLLPEKKVNIRSTLNIRNLISSPVGYFFIFLLKLIFQLWRAVRPLTPPPSSFSTSFSILFLSMWFIASSVCVSLTSSNIVKNSLLPSRTGLWNNGVTTVSVSPRLKQTGMREWVMHFVYWSDEELTPVDLHTVVSWKYNSVDNSALPHLWK